MSQFFTSGGQSIGVSASPSILPMNIQTLGAHIHTKKALISFKSEKEVLLDKDVLIEIPWIEEPGGLQSMELQESDTTEHTHTTHNIFIFTSMQS